KSDLPWICGCSDQHSTHAVEIVTGISDRHVVDTCESETEDCSDAEQGHVTVSKALASRHGLVLARRRIFSPHVRSKFQACYKIIRQLGEGSYGNVYEAETLCADGAVSSTPSRRVAVKCFKLSQDKSDDTKLVLRESFEKERFILARMEHPHIVKMYECFEERGSLWIALELCRGGEL
ncbi:unnamed protein product, partial [Polarella glacialis]